MKIINYDKLLAEHKSKGHISQDANQLANSLIREYCIRDGRGLAHFLNVDTCHDNYNAVRVWVQQQLDKQDDYPADYLVEEMRLKLQSRLSELLPNTDYE